MRRKAALLLVLAALVTLGACGAAPAESAGTELNVYCFSAGKADAFLLWTEDSAVLIDCGEKGFGQTILEKLTELGITKLDYLIITHFDKDHVGGAATVLDGIEVGTVLQTGTLKESSQVEKYLAALESAGLTAVTVGETMTFTLDGVSYTVDPPRKQSYDESESNNASLIVAVENGENRLLFLGDAEEERLEEFLAGSWGTFDFVKLPHHGRLDARTAELIEATSPAYAVITSSEEEPEDREVLDLLDAAGTVTFLTRTGPVLVRSDGTALTVSYA